MAEEKEQLKIEATLDTSKLKRDAQQGMQTVVNEEKKVENQSRQTSRAVDNIGQSGKNVGKALQQAGSQGTDALRKVGQEADKTSKKIDDIAKATKGIRLQHALGVANQFAGSLGPLGRAVGESMGMSEDEINTTGGMISGGLRGAAAGAALGPWGAAIGGLVGAGAVLIEAGNELKKGAKEAEDRWNETKKQSYDRQGAEKFAELIRNGTTSEITDKIKEEMRNIASANADIADLQGQNAEVTKRIVQSVIDPISGGTYQEERIVRDEAETKKRASELTEKLTNAEKRRAEALTKLNALQIALSQRESKTATNTSTKPPSTNNWFDKFSEQAANSYFSDVAKWQNENRREELSNRLKDNESLISRRQSLIEGMSSTKLTDSMVRMGAGGYGIQMQGINSYVRNMSSTLEALNKISENILTTIRSINDKYTPYSGEFI